MWLAWRLREVERSHNTCRGLLSHYNIQYRTHPIFLPNTGNATDWWRVPGSPIAASHTTYRLDMLTTPQRKNRLFGMLG